MKPEEAAEKGHALRKFLKHKKFEKHIIHVHTAAPVVQGAKKSGLLHHKASHVKPAANLEVAQNELSTNQLSVNK